MQSIQENTPEVSQLSRWMQELDEWVAFLFDDAIVIMVALVEHDNQLDS